MKLGSLIRQRYEELNTTWPAMVERAQAAGHEITRNYLMVLAKDGHREPPRLETLYAVAAAIDVPVEQVFLAAGVSLGLHLQPPVEQDRGAQAFLALTAGRSQSEVSALLAALEAQVRLLDASRAAQTATTG